MSSILEQDRESPIAENAAKNSYTHGKAKIKTVQIQYNTNQIKNQKQLTSTATSEDGKSQFSTIPR